jgi:hypothetical protein
MHGDQAIAQAEALAQTIAALLANGRFWSASRIPRTMSAKKPRTASQSIQNSGGRDQYAQGVG